MDGLLSSDTDVSEEEWGQIGELMQGRRPSPDGESYWSPRDAFAAYTFDQLNSGNPNYAQLQAGLNDIKGTGVRPFAPPGARLPLLPIDMGGVLLIPDRDSETGYRLKQFEAEK